MSRAVIPGIARLTKRAAIEAHAALALTRAGVIRLEAPGGLVSTLRALAVYGPVGGAVIGGAARYPNRPAMIDERGPLSYRELDRRSNAVARGWQAIGITDGSTVGVLCRNHRGFIESVLACAKVGARTLYLNTDFSGPQLRDVCAREGVDLLVYDEEFAAVVDGAPAPRGRFVAWTDTETGTPAAADGTVEELATGDGGPLPPPECRGSIVLLTSGTTGTPKGAPRAQPRSLAGGGAVLSKVPFRAGDLTYVAAPMFHGLGFLLSQLTLAIGATLVVRRRFDPAAVLADLAEHHATGLVVIPTMLQRMLAALAGGEQPTSAADLSALRIVFCGGAQLPAELARQARAALGDVVYNMYGSTEVAWATFANPEDLRAAPGCAGRAPFGTVVRLYDDADRVIDRPGATGRIFVGNALPFDGYTGGGSRRVLDGLMATGDVGHFDAAGRLFIDGRDDDMIVSGGENVFPGEVEELLVTHPTIEDAAVVGVPDAEYGQRLVAFVVSRAGQALTADQVKDFVRGSLARYKSPRDVVFLDALPRNPSGKVLKRQLATMVPAEPAKPTKPAKPAG